MKATDIEYHPSGYNFSSKFEALSLVEAFEGGLVYTAKYAGQPVLVTDESTLLDMLGDDDAELADKAVAVRYFTGEAERAAYIHEFFAARRGTKGGSGSGAPATGIDVRDHLFRGAEMAGDASFREFARERQADFRSTLPVAARTLTDGKWADVDFLLALGHEDENLHPILRGVGGARAYFRERAARWWHSGKTGDAGENGPTRNLTSSQIACVNLFLPLRHRSELLAAMLRVVDPDIAAVAPVESTGAGGKPLSSLVELEWTGRRGTLEGGGSRGAYATSADACLVGITYTGKRRAFLVEFKYTESYGEGPTKRDREMKAERMARYQRRYECKCSCFSQAAPLEEVLCQPFYQLVRLGLLGDAARDDPDLAISDVKVVVVVPAGNTAYRETITSSLLRSRFPHASSVEEVARRLWKRPGDFCMLDPAQLVDAVRAHTEGHAVEAWSTYMNQRYGW